MENASKALIIAATTILAVFLIALFVYIFKAGSGVSETYDKKQQREQLELFNSRFEIYNTTNNTIMSLISVANLAYSVNIDCEYDTSRTVNIEINANGKKFKIPGDARHGLEKNQILLDNNPISIYKLATDSLDAFGISNGVTDTLATTKYKDQNTIYKYLFDCVNLKYHDDSHGNGQVSEMIFNMKANPNY